MTDPVLHPAPCRFRRPYFQSLAAGILLAALAFAPDASAQTDGTIPVLRQRIMIFDATGLVGSSADTVTLPPTIASGQHFVGNRSLDARSGQFAQVYHANPTGSNAVYFRTGRNGTDWSTPVQVSDPRFEDCHYASVRYVGRSTHLKLVVTYLSRTASTAQDTLWGTFSTDGGVTWAPSAVIGAHPQAIAMIPTLHSAGDTVNSVWTRSPDGGSWNQTFINRSRNAGTTWDTMLVAIEGSQNSFYSHLVMGAAGRAYIVTSDDQGGKMNAQLSRSTNAGAQWREVTNVNSESGLGSPQNLIFYPALEVSGNTLYSVWSDNREGQSNIYFARSDNSGTNWTPHIRISGDQPLSPAVNDAGQAGARRAAISLSGLGRLYVVWADDREGPSTVEAERNRDIYITQSTDGGDTWSTPIRVNTAPQVRGQESPAMAIHSTGTRDSVLVVWSDMRTTGSAVPADPLADILASSGALRIGSVADEHVRIEIPPSHVGRAIVVTLVDAEGRLVARLFDGASTAESLSVPITSNTLPAGVYFLHAASGRASATAKLILLD